MTPPRGGFKVPRVRLVTHYDSRALAGVLTHRSLRQTAPPILPNGDGGARFNVMQNAQRIVDADDNGAVTPAAGPDDYAFDVFISYNYSNLMRRWVNDFFYDIFVEYLGNAMDDAPRMNLFEREVNAGDRWPDHLRSALLRSKVLVAVCSHEYFRSGWCRSEWESFRLREQKLKCDGLCIPVIHDGKDEFFKREGLDSTQYVDLRDCAFFFGNTATHPDAPILDKKVKLLAASVAAQVKKAPTFDPNWPLAAMPAIPPPNILLQRLKRS